MSSEARWTLDELVRRVEAALAGPAYPGAPNGRVRDVPDRRAVRWYATIGLVDRPAAMQGRTALYGARHLLQIVAVKRRQAEGRSLAEIQSELAGAPDDTLRSIAEVPDELIAAEQGPQQHPAPAPHTTQPAADRSATTSRRGRFWADGLMANAAVTLPSDTGQTGTDTVTMLAAVRLPGGAVMLLPGNPDLPGRPDDADISAINSAARPLLELLANRDLLTLEGVHHDRAHQPDERRRGGPGGRPE